MVQRAGDEDEIVDSTGLLISIPLYLVLFIFQSSVLFHFIYKIHGRELSHKIKFGSLAVLLVAWFGILFEFATILFNLSFAWPTETGYCSFIIWFRYNWFIIFEFTLYVFWLIRINHTFKFSVFEIKRKFIVIVVFIVGTVSLIFIIITAISIIPQYQVVDLSLSSDEYGYDCIPDWQILGGILAVYIVGQIATIIFNLFFAGTFFYKLGKLQEIAKHDKGSAQSNVRTLRIFQLMQKHTLLALLSLFTSIVCWLVFDSLALSASDGIHQDMLVILSIDRVVKSLCIILMYKFYERPFAKICHLCLIMTHADCVSKKVQEMFPYFDPKPEDPALHAATIYAVAQKIQVQEDIYGEDISVDEAQVHHHEAIADTSPNPHTPTIPDMPNKPLPQNLNHHIVISHKRQSKSMPSKQLPTPDHFVEKYSLMNFIACLTDPKHRKYRYLNYSKKNYPVIPTQIFNHIEDNDQNMENDEININFINKTQGLVIFKNNEFQFDQNKFSFIKKDKTKYPYRLAIRLKEHNHRLEDAQKLLKYAEYKLNEAFKEIKADTSFDYEIYFDRIAKEIHSGKLIRGNYSYGNVFMNFEGSAVLEMQPPNIEVAWSRNSSRDLSYEPNMDHAQHQQRNSQFGHQLNVRTSAVFQEAPHHFRQLTPSVNSINSANHDHKPLPPGPITPYQSVDYGQTQ